MNRLWARGMAWLQARPLVWRAGLLGLALALAGVIMFSPLPPLLTSLAAVGLILVAGVLIASLTQRLPLEICFLIFVALMPATRFSLFESSFSFQANFLALIAVAALLVWRAGIGRLPLRLPRSRVHTAVLILFAVLALSFFLSVQVPAGGFRGEVRWVRSAKQIAYFAFMLITYATILLVVQDRRLFRWALWTYIGASVVVSLYGLYQFVAYPLGWPFVDLFPSTASFGQSSIWAIPLAGGRFLRIWSVASEPVWFGDYLAGVIPVAGVLALSKGVSARRRLWLFLALAVMIVALLLTFTRSAYLAVLAGAVVLAIYRPDLAKRGLRVAGIGLAALLLVSLIVAELPVINQASLVNAVVERFISPFQDENFGNIHRTTAIAASWAMFKAKPWGVGYGNYGFFFYDFKPAWGRAFTDVFTDAFPVMSGSILLRLLTETSIPGVLAFVWLVLAVVLEGVAAWRAWAGKDPFMEAAAVGLLAGFITLMVRLLAADSIHFTYQWFVIAMIVAARRLARGDISARPAEGA
jgi:O-antigen ligase